MASEPLCVHVQRRREIQDVWVLGFQEMRNTNLRSHVRRADIDRVHQIKTLHRRFERAGEKDRARVIDQDVDAAKLGHGLIDCLEDLIFEPQIGHARQAVSASSIDLFDRREDRARKFRVRLGGFGNDRDVSSVGGSFQSDRLPDASA